MAQAGSRSAVADHSDEAIIRRCAWKAGRGIGPGLGRDDLLQEARLAIWMARTAGRVPQGDELHVARYLAQRAYGAMVDASRAAWRQRPAVVEDLNAEYEGRHVDGPDVRAQIMQALERLAQKGSPRVRDCIELLARGQSYQEAAISMGVSASRVSQLVNDARAIVAHCV